MIAELIKPIREPSSKQYMLQLVACDLSEQAACVGAGFSRKTGQRRRAKDRVLADAHARVKAIYSQAKENGTLDALKAEVAELLGKAEVPTREIELPTELSDDLKRAVETKMTRVKSQAKRTFLEKLLACSCRSSLAAALSGVTEDQLADWCKSDQEFVGAAKRIEGLFTDLVESELASYSSHRSDRLFSSWLRAEFPARYQPEAGINIQNNHFVNHERTPEEAARYIAAVYKRNEELGLEEGHDELIDEPEPPKTLLDT